MDRKTMTTLDKIVKACAKEFETTAKAIRGRDEYTWASGPETKGRQIAMWLYRETHKEPGYEQVLAEYFGRHVSTVFHNLRRIDQQSTDPRPPAKRIRRHIENIRAALSDQTAAA